MQSLLLFALVVGAHRLFSHLPDREELGPAAVELRMEPLDLGFAAAGPFDVAGAWRVSSQDARLTGVSALGVDGPSLIALTDSGVAVRLAKPETVRGTALIDELPSGPGKRGSKRNRDSEALLRDSAGRGWWVAFEFRDEIWLYDETLRTALKRIRLRGTRWGRNAGLEAIASEGGHLLLLPETRSEVLRLDAEGRIRRVPIRGLEGRVSEAASLPGGGLLLVERRLTPLGFRNALVRIAQTGEVYRVTGRTELPLGPLYNVEGLALERLPDGRLRAWLATDDGHQRRSGTLLLALDVAAPGRRERVRRSPRPPSS